MNDRPHFRAWTVTSNVDSNAAVIVFPCIVNAVIQTRLGPGGSSFWFYDSTSGPTGRLLLTGTNPFPVGLSGLGVRMENGIWLQTVGMAAAASYWTLVVSPL